MTKPNYNYLKEKKGIKNSKDLKNLLLSECKELDFEELAKDVQPLVFNSRGLKLIKLFPDFVKQAEF